MNNILDKTYKQLQAEISAFGEKPFRTSQIYEWIYKKRVFDFSMMHNLSLGSRDLLSAKYDIFLPEITKRSASKVDDTVKFLLTLYDSNTIESVLMKYRHGYSLCISSQVGCRMGCVFCASGELGLIRNLTPGEFNGQILAIEKNEDIKISNVVVMGIGEPLDNFDNLIDFIDIANDEHGMNIGIRSFTVSTCGLVDKIYKLSDMKLQINLALSLHTTNDIKRQEIMPVAKKYPVDEVIAAMKYYCDKTGRRPTYEYTLIKGLNDSVIDAKNLADKLSGSISHVNLILLNETHTSELKKSEEHVAGEFANVLNKRGIEVTIRRRLGTDIDAACGQLRRSNSEG